MRECWYNEGKSGNQRRCAGRKRGLHLWIGGWCARVQVTNKHRAWGHAAARQGQQRKQNHASNCHACGWGNQGREGRKGCFTITGVFNNFGYAYTHGVVAIARVIREFRDQCKAEHSQQHCDDPQSELQRGGIQMFMHKSVNGDQMSIL
jgi:hypothetical protein